MSHWATQSFSGQLAKSTGVNLAAVFQTIANTSGGPKIGLSAFAGDERVVRTEKVKQALDEGVVEIKDAGKYVSGAIPATKNKSESLRHADQCAYPEKPRGVIELDSE